MTDSSAEQTQTNSKKNKKKGWTWWANLSYSRKLTVSFALIAAMTAGVATLLLSVVWEQHFQSYTRENIETTAAVTAERIGQKYGETGEWNSDTVSVVDLVRLTYPDIGIIVLDAKGDVHYDSARADADASTASPSSQAKLMEDSQMAIAPIMVDDQNVGMVRVWVVGTNSLLRSSDLEFRDNSYQTMLIAAIVAIFLASICGFVFASNLVHPIRKLTSTAQAIKGGDLSARTELSGGDEISHLGEAFDAMAESMEQERAHERRLTTDVAHELRTPLMALQATTEAMIDGVFEADEERLGVVNGEVQRLSRMVNALLELSRLESRSTPVKKDLVNVGDVVEGVVVTHEAFVSDSGLEISFETQPDVVVMGDADMIRQATANLISNAVRYTPEGGSIKVSVRKGEIMASIAVEDTGIGLTSEEAKQVFNRFWRADAGRQRESGGLGIGLSVVKEIVDRHGGWIQVEGKKDVGARFTIHIPLYNKEKEEAAKREAEKKAQQQKKKLERTQKEQEKARQRVQQQRQRAEQRAEQKAQQAQKRQQK